MASSNTDSFATMTDSKQPVDETPEVTPPAQDAPETPPVEADPLQLAIAERDEMRDQFLRARAEMENLRKRQQREREEERRYASLRLISELLPVIDNLQRAIDAGKKADAQDASLLTGVEMVARSFADILQEHGVTPIPALEQPFDPNVHEALQQLPSADHPPMTVIQELETGFKLHDRVIRPSKVIVSSAPPTEA